MIAFKIYIWENFAVWYLKDKAQNVYLLWDMRFSMVVNMKVPVFRDVTLHRLMDRYWHFGGIYSTSTHNTKAAGSSEMSETFLIPDYTAAYPRRKLVYILPSSNYSLAILYFELNPRKQFSAFILDNSKYYKL